MSSDQSKSSRTKPCRIYLPSLQTVTDTVVLDGISSISRLCTPYSPIEGQYKLGNNARLCNGGLGSHESLSRNAKIGIGVGVVCVPIIIVGCTVALLVARRRRRRDILALKTMPELSDSDTNVNMLDYDSEKHELQSPTEAQELPGQHGRTELHRHTSPSRVPPGIESRHEMPAKGICTPRRFSWEKSPISPDED